MEHAGFEVLMHLMVTTNIEDSGYKEGRVHHHFAYAAFLQNAWFGHNVNQGCDPFWGLALR
jgi:hypothetical protein